MRKLPIFLLLAALFAAFLAVPAYHEAALAFGQRDDGVIRPSAPERKSFFDIFRFDKKVKKRAKPLPPADVDIRVKSRPTSSSGDDDFGIKIEMLAKDENAKTVLVVGDFFAEMLARGLDEAFAETPSLRVASSIQEHSGLANPGKADWPALVREALAKDPADFIVVMLGANDRKALDTNPATEFRGEGWEAGYKSRIEALLTVLRDAGKPIYLVGLPPVGDSATSGDYTYFNDLYRVATFSVGGRFIDIWNNFLDAEGQYSRKGPDLEGTEKQLRWRDDARFTRAGRRKLAYYVEREIRRDAGLGSGLAAVPEGGGGPLGAELYKGTWGERPTIGPVLSLTNPRLDYGAPLAGAVDETFTPPEDRPQYLLVVRGEALPAQSGRVDDFSWPPGSGAAVPAATAVTPSATDGDGSGQADGAGDATAAVDATAGTTDAAVSAAGNENPAGMAPAGQ